MKKPGKQELWQAATCLLCVIAVGRLIDILGNSEFGGGYVSGRLFWLADKGWVLLLLALLLSFVLRRAAAWLFLAASLLCWPLYLYVMFPGVARWIIRTLLPYVIWENALVANVIWDKWLIAGILALIAATYVCVRNLSPIVGARSR
jgi:hypothetical protein